MVAKGLNFENVTLVGVLDADQSLYVSHFRAAETTFSMLAQVIGRAGRGQTEGLAVIQTMTPEHPVIQLAAAQDYAAFYEMEIQLRQLRNCPPFADEIMITFHGASEEAVIESAVRFRGASGAAAADQSLCSAAGAGVGAGARADCQGQQPLPPPAVLKL